MSYLTGQWWYIQIKHNYKYAKDKNSQSQRASIAQQTSNTDITNWPPLVTSRDVHDKKICFTSGLFINAIILFRCICYVRLICFQNSFCIFRLISYIGYLGSIRIFGSYFRRFGFSHYAFSATLHRDFPVTSM